MADRKNNSRGFIQKTLAVIAPGFALRREQNLAKLEVLQKRSYDGGTKGRRGDGWTNDRNIDANIDIGASLTTLRERSVNGYKNDSNVFSAIRKIQNNTIGTGIMPTPKTVPGGKKLTQGEIDVIKAMWESFAETSGFDFDGFFNVYGIQSMIMRNVPMQGGVLVMRERDTTSPVGFRIRVLDPSWIDINKTMVMSDRAGNIVRQGVEFDSRGRRVGYWIFDSNPVDQYRARLSAVFVSIKDCRYVFYKEFPNQIHGVPFGTSAMLTGRDLADYKDAQLMLQKISACHVAFTTKEGDAGATVENSQLIDRMEPGMIERLPAGETVTFNNPPTPSGYREYVTKTEMSIASAYGITYEQMTGDMGNVNFSSGRMGWIEAQRQIEDWQYNMFIPQVCEPIWDWFIDGMILMGMITKRAAAEWTPQGREMIDPVKEMNGLILELKSGLVSWTEACKRRGYNPDALMKQMKADKKLFEDAGIDVEWIITEAEKEIPEPTTNQAAGGKK